jgi:hypothetical protein
VRTARIPASRPGWWARPDADGIALARAALAMLMRRGSSAAPLPRAAAGVGRTSTPAVARRSQYGRTTRTSAAARPTVPGMACRAAAGSAWCRGCVRRARSRMIPSSHPR